MNKILLLGLLFVTHVQATEYTLDPHLYQDALNEVQGGASKQTRVADSNDVVEWDACMSLMGSESLEQQLQGKLGLLQLFKKNNPSLDDVALSTVMSLHEQALQNNLKACMHLGLALLRGADGDVIYPRSVDLALFYFELVEDSLSF